MTLLALYASVIPFAFAALLWLILAADWRGVYEIELWRAVAYAAFWAVLWPVPLWSLR